MIALIVGIVSIPLWFCVVVSSRLVSWRSLITLSLAATICELIGLSKPGNATKTGRMLCEVDAIIIAIGIQMPGISRDDT